MNTSNKMDSPENKINYKKRTGTKETSETLNNKLKVDSSAEISQFKTQEITSPKIDRKKHNLTSSRDQGDIRNNSSSKKKISKSPTLRKEKSKSNNELQVNISRRTHRKKVKFSDPFVDPVNIESFKKFNLGMSYSEAEPEETTRCKCVIF
jgi:hypothetical protein